MLYTNVSHRLWGPGITLFLIPQVSDTGKRQASCMAWWCDSGRPLSKRYDFMHKQTIKHTSAITAWVIFKMGFNNSTCLWRALTVSHMTSSPQTGTETARRAFDAGFGTSSQLWRTCGELCDGQSSWMMEDSASQTWDRQLISTVLIL